MNKKMQKYFNPSVKEKDFKFLALARNYALNGCGHTRPNPPVGAAIVYRGKVLAGGVHRRAGGDHAEVKAIRNVKDKNLLKYSTLYVTLEP